jgi:hypothetical protein
VWYGVRLTIRGSRRARFTKMFGKKKKERGKEEKRKEKTAIPESRVRVVFDVFLRN